MESETVWRALASPHRRKLLDLLRNGPRTTGELSKALPDLSRFAVMQHLTVLAEAGLVLFRKEGRSRLNYLNPAPIRELYERWMRSHSSLAAETALHLKRYAQSTSEVAHKMDPNSYRLLKIEMELRINAPRDRVFAAFTEEYDNWWPHRYKPDSTCVCDPRPGGFIEERFAGGGGAITGTIVYIDAPHKIASSAPSALCQGNTAYGVETFEEDGEGTMYKKRMQLWGTVPDETEQMFTQGMKAMMEGALKGYLEGGVKYAKEIAK